MLGQVARGGAGRAAGEVQRGRLQALQAGALPRRLLRREQRPLARAQAVQQHVHECLRAERVQAVHEASMQLHAALDAFARLGRHLG